MPLLVSERTRRQCEADFRWSDAPALAVKGKTEPVRTHIPG